MCKAKGNSKNYRRYLFNVRSLVIISSDPVLQRWNSFIINFVQVIMKSFVV